MDRLWLPLPNTLLVRRENCKIRVTNLRDVIIWELSNSVDFFYSRSFLVLKITQLSVLGCCSVEDAVMSSLHEAHLSKAVAIYVCSCFCGRLTHQEDYISTEYVLKYASYVQIWKDIFQVKHYVILIIKLLQSCYFNFRNMGSYRRKQNSGFMRG